MLNAKRHVPCAGTIVALLALGFITAPRPARAESPATAPSTQPVNKFCAVNTTEAVDPKVTTVYKGKTFAFCCEECIKDFQKDPEKYASKAK